jgi:N-acetylmuramoyl-L-alanine amidase
VKSAAATPIRSATSKAAGPAVALRPGDVVVIDAGHQAHGDSSLEPIGPGASQMKPKVADGASGPYEPHDESQVNLAVALKLRDELTARGVRVVMVRTSQNVNIANSQRAAIANRAHAALFIRLHCDGISDSSRHGFSTLIPASNQWTRPIVSSSSRAGHLIQAAALRATGASDAGVVNRGDLSGFNWSKVPTVLVEMGFMSNPTEDRSLTTSGYQHKLAVGIANGIMSFVGSR